MPKLIGKLVEDDPNCLLRDNRKGNNFIKHKPDGEENRFELFLLDDGQKKVEWKDETRKFSPFDPSIQYIPWRVVVANALDNRNSQHHIVHI
jgi:hypothetical protein